MNRAGGMGVLALVVLPMLALCALMATSAPGCTSQASDAVDIAGITDAALEGLSGDPDVRMEQLVNAGHVMNAAVDVGLEPVRPAQEIGVMTALGESGLRVLDHGDAAGPDSVGLFQQRDNGAWGSYEDRMNPTVSARNFFAALTWVPGWNAVEPTYAAHMVQRNADAEHYRKYTAASVAIVAHLSGAGQCGSPGADDRAPESSTSGWVKPLAVPTQITSRFGMRLHPIQGAWRLHAGSDLSASCGTPIYAVADGTVVAAGGAGSGRQRDLVRIDHGGGQMSGYMHMYAAGIFVRPGDHVDAGDRIAAVGSAGWSTGCHLHLEIREKGAYQDPVPFLAERGVVLP